MHTAVRYAPRSRVMRAGFFLVVPGIALLGACAPEPPRSTALHVTMVVLPKASDGHVGAVMVRPLSGGQAVLVDQPYVEASLSDTTTVRTAPIDPKAVKEKFGKTLAALPAYPTSILVYFLEGTDALNPEAARAIDRIVAEVAARPAPEIAIVAHADFFATDQYNDAFSLRRAGLVKDLLVRRGIPAKIIQTAGRGRRGSPIPTSDGVAEPRNRRVEITVR